MRLKGVVGSLTTPFHVSEERMADKSVYLFKGEPEYDAFGRNGSFKQKGVAVHLICDTVFIRPITSKGEVSDNARVVLPVGDIPGLIAALLEIETKACEE